MQLVVRFLVDPLEVLQLHGVADARHHVLALRVLQVVAVDALRAGARVPGEGHAGAGVVAQVAEDHGHDADRRAEVPRNALLPPVKHRAAGVPRLEHREHREVHLLARVLRELPAGVRDDKLLEGRGERLHVLGVQLRVAGDALGLLRRLDRVLEVVAVDAEDGLAEHLDQPPVGVPGEPLVARLLGQAVDRVVRQADVQDGVHHARHGEFRAGPDADQERVGGIAEPAAHGPFECCQMARDLIVKAVGGACRAPGNGGTRRS